MIDSSGNREDPDAIVFEQSEPGWWRVTGDFPRLFVFTRLTEQGHAYIACLILADEGREPDSTDLRRIPLGRITAGLHHPKAKKWATAGPTEIDFLAALHRAADEAPTDARLKKTWRGMGSLQRPPKQGSDGFYQQVAAAYRYYTQLSHKPAIKIADEAGVPVATARRWINEARQRGHLERGERGRAGG